MEIVFTERELDVMAIVWDRGGATVAEVRERLKDELAYTTVLTVLRTLEEKGYVRHEEVVLSKVVDRDVIRRRPSVPRYPPARPALRR